jgi:hypothetical protein
MYRILASVLQATLFEPILRLIYILLYRNNCCRLWSSFERLSVQRRSLFMLHMVKGKGTPNRPEGPEGDRLFLNLGARRGWMVSTKHRPLYPLEWPSTHCTGGLVGPRAGLDVCEKSHLHRNSIPGIVQPVASHYTNWAISAPTLNVEPHVINT